jgi:hypothetical protein
MRSTWFYRGGRAALALAVTIAMVGVTTPAAGKPVPGRPGKRSGLNLFALTFGVMNVNRVFCGINNIGEVCVDPTNSPVVGGGFWPKGTPDQYVFNSGLQLAGTIPASAGFAWAGDTVGAYFMDPRGTQAQGDPVTLVYNSLDLGDAAGWPNGGIVRDTAIYANVLLSRQSVSQQDLWVRTWDGNPAFLSGRTHPMGILVEERGMAWNFPTGNEDIIYFVYTFYNVTARDPAAYLSLDPSIRGEIAAIGADFQNRNEARFGLDIPDGGYTVNNMFAAFFADMDVGDASVNYATAVIPFAMGVAYKADFLEPSWQFPPEIFGAPFVPSPGFIGVKYLRSPLDSTGQPVGLTVFSNTLNSATGYPDPVGVIQLYRYLSGTSSPAAGDFACTFQGQQLSLHFCFVAQNFADTRFFQSSGPLTLGPGQSQTIVVAYINAAPTAVVVPFIGGDFKPGIPANGSQLGLDTTKVRPIERAMGWVTQADDDSNFVITQSEVQTLPRSLLNKALVAQAVYDAKFLLPFAPDAPPFFLIPGDNQVTVVWQKSATETTGDPYFAVASQPTSIDPITNNIVRNPLYDPNFRQFDVEGYRIYRGRSTSDLRLVAQYDYTGTVITDYTGSFAYTEDLDGDGLAQCAPEFGLQADCPITFATDTPFVDGADHDIVGNIVQVPVGGRTVLQGKDTVVVDTLGDSIIVHKSGSVLVLSADTAVSGAGSGSNPALSNSGVTFSFIDRGVRNTFSYFYAVTAFDVNSFISGPSSLESARITKTVTPRAGSGQEVAGQLSAIQLLGADGSVLTGTDPTLDPATGIFSGPLPPTDGLILGLANFLPELLGATGQVSLTIDSVLPGAELNGIDPVYYARAQGSGAAVDTFAFPVHQDAFDGLGSGSSSFPATNIDQAQSVRFGGDASYALFGSTTINLSGTWHTTGQGRGDANAAPANSAVNGPRWWSGTPNENTNDPNGTGCIPSAGGCVQLDLSRTAGALPGVDTIFHVASYLNVPNVPQRNMEALTSTVFRAADIKVVWGANGAIDSVIDLTHKVPVPFSTKIRASWGILNDSSFILGGTNPATTRDANTAKLTWSDIFCVDPAPSFLAQCGGAAQSPAVLQDHARLSPIVAGRSATYAGTAAAGYVSGGNGFIFYLNGHFFLMQMAALPAAGTVWNARFYSGVITGTAAGGDFAFTPDIRPPAVPGLRAVITYTGSTFDPSTTTAANLARVHTVPDPYYVTNALEATANTKVLKFVNLPAQAIVRIYSLSGVLVNVLTHNDVTGGGDLTWNLRNRNNQFVASGVYFYHVETPDGQAKVGRFTVVNFAP